MTMSFLIEYRAHVIDLFQVESELKDVTFGYRSDGVYKPCFEALSRFKPVKIDPSETVSPFAIGRA